MTERDTELHGCWRLISFNTSAFKRAHSTLGRRPERVPYLRIRWANDCTGYRKGAGAKGHRSGNTDEKVVHRKDGPAPGPSELLFGSRSAVRARPLDHRAV